MTPLNDPVVNYYNFKIYRSVFIGPEVFLERTWITHRCHAKGNCLPWQVESEDDTHSQVIVFFWFNRLIIRV